MSRHDHQDADDNMPSGQFDGDEIEFAPFMFDPSSQPVDVSTSQIGVGDMDMEFEPFMFNQGEALGVPARSETAATPAQPQSAPVAAPAPAIQPLTGAPASIQSLPNAPAVPSPSEGTSQAVMSAPPQPAAVQETTMPDIPASPTSPAPTPFAGHEVPMPSYLMPVATADPAPESAMEAPSPADASPAPAGMAPLPDWFAGSTPSSGPVQQEVPFFAAPPPSTGPIPTGPIPTGPMPTGPMPTGPMPTGPMPTGPMPTGPMPTGPIEAQVPPAPAPVVAPVPAPALVAVGSSLGGMTGRSRGNTGPLAANLSGTSWSDHSLASVEDFSSVLIALYAGKRQRQSGSPGDTMLSQVASPGSATATATQTAVSVQEQPVIPDWAVQSMAGTADSPAPAAAAAAWGVSQWDPQSPPAAAGSAWPGTVQPQTVMPEGEPLPGWNTNPAGQSSEGTSWTAAQPQSPTAAPTSTAAQQAAAPETAAPRPTAVASSPGRPTPELDAIRQVSLDQPSANLDSGVSDLLKTVDTNISEGSVNGDELEFENFMFNQGVSAPLPVLPSVDDPAALANSLPRDAGPVFDPTLYSNPAEMVETFDYSDIDPDAFGAPAGDAPKPAGVQGPLPFWLQDQPQHGAPASEGAAQSPLNPAPGTQRPAANPVSGDTTADDLAVGDLPPIVPFDFSTIGGDLEDEPFGFNTEELSGFVMGDRDPMVVTANLEALADLMGGHAPTVPDTKASRSGGLSELDMAAPPALLYPHPQIAPSQPPEEVEGAFPVGAADDDVSAETPTSRFTPEASEQAEQDGAPDTGGWMATVTGDLPPDPVAALAGSLGGAPNADIVIEDLDVAPFDYSQLDLDDENESPTSYLQTGGTLQGPATSKLQTASEGNIPHEQREEGKGKVESSVDAAPDEVWSEADGDTSLFMPMLAEGETEQAEQTDDAEMPTSYLREQASPDAPAGESTASPAPASTAWLAEQSPEVTGMNGMAGQSSELANGHMPAEPEQSLFKARVARGPWGNQVQAAPEPQPTPEPAPSPQQAQSSAATETPLRKAKATAVLPSLEEASHRPRTQPAPSTTTSGTPGASAYVAFEQESPKLPAPGDIMASGPLPVLHGFEDLTAWIDRYPNDMGAHLALASAYTQAGDVDTALRVYRRMLRKSYVSENILAMIQDELHDLEDQAHQYPRYYQVRGDLLVRQGHRREAIDEYNKLS